MRHVIPAERQHVLVILPVTLHERDIEPFLFEEAFFNRGKDRRFARQADVANANFVRTLSRDIRSFVAAR